MQRTALIRMNSFTDIEGSGTMMGEELSKSVGEQQLDRPPKCLDCDRPGFITRATRAKSYTLPDPVLQQSKVKQGFTMPERW